MAPIAKTRADLDSHYLSRDPEFSKIVPFLLGISEFVARHLPSEDLIKRKSATEGRPKLLSDNVVGYVRLQPWEAELLDTPLFQRLRRISQLSFVEQVYPTLGYCRFEHMIGVLGRTAQIIVALEQNTKSARVAEELNIEKIVGEHEQAVRLAALFHDVGHCIYSHASESFMETLLGDADDYPAVSFIREVFRRAFRRAKQPPVAEVLSVAILLSPEILSFLTVITGQREDSAKKRIRNAAFFVLGCPPPDNGRLLFLAQIISSGLDADKLDYMARESHYSGIPLGVDIPWLLSKLGVFKCDSKSLPRAYTSLKESYPTETVFYALGLGASGQLEFEEFCFARVSLYDKIYLHQKNRALTAQAHLEFRRVVKRSKNSDMRPSLAGFSRSRRFSYGAARDISAAACRNESCDWTYCIGP